MTDIKPIEKEGWGPTQGKKWHYFQFREGEGLAFSICNKIGFYGAKELLELEQLRKKENI